MVIIVRLHRYDRLFRMWSCARCSSLLDASLASHLLSLQEYVTMRPLCSLCWYWEQCVHIPGESVGKRGSSRRLAPYAAGTQPCPQTPWQQWGQWADSMCRRNLWGTCWCLFGQGLCRADPLSALSTTFEKVDVPVSISVKSDSRVCGASCNCMLTIEICSNLMLKILCSD